MQPKLNLELKYFCKDFKPVRAVLKDLGARKMSVRRQTDYYFNVPKDKKARVRAHVRLKLRTEGKKQTLIYYTRPDFSSAIGKCSDIDEYSATQGYKNHDKYPGTIEKARAYFL